MLKKCNYIHIHILEITQLLQRKEDFKKKFKKKQISSV